MCSVGARLVPRVSAAVAGPTQPYPYWVYPFPYRTPPWPRWPLLNTPTPRCPWTYPYPKVTHTTSRYGVPIPQGPNWTHDRPIPHGAPNAYTRPRLDAPMPTETTLRASMTIPLTLPDPRSKPSEQGERQEKERPLPLSLPLPCVWFSNLDLPPQESIRHTCTLATFASTAQIAGWLFLHRTSSKPRDSHIHAHSPLPSGCPGTQAWAGTGPGPCALRIAPPGPEQQRVAISGDERLMGRQRWSAIMWHLAKRMVDGSGCFALIKATLTNRFPFHKVYGGSRFPAHSRTHFITRLKSPESHFNLQVSVSHQNHGPFLPHRHCAKQLARLITPSRLPSRLQLWFLAYPLKTTTETFPDPNPGSGTGLQLHDEIKYRHGVHGCKSRSLGHVCAVLVGPKPSVKLLNGIIAPPSE